MELRLRDESRRWAAVTLDAALYGGACRWHDGWWTRSVDTSGVRRLEYKFWVTTRDGRCSSMLDPLCHNVVHTGFGDKSEWRARGYREPGWLSADAVRGRMTTTVFPSTLAGGIPARVWIPVGLRTADPAPLLWCHDGSGYVDGADITQWAGAHIAAGDLPPFRLVLADARQRMSWYSGSAAYLRSARNALTALTDRYAVHGPVAVLGSSLGGLTSLLLAAGDSRIGAVLSQSGSFFEPGPRGRSDAGFRWYPRISSLVRELKSAPPPRHTLSVALTWGAAEGNRGNNERMAAALTRRGWDVRAAELPGQHTMTDWRDGFDPILPNLLRDSWGAQG